MNDISGELCRFCLKIIRDQNFEEIGGIVWKILDVLLIGMDLSIDGRCLMCKDCQGSLEKCFNFKAACVYLEDSIASYIKEGSKLDLEKLYLERKLRQTSEKISRGHKICRLCMKISKTTKCLKETVIDKLQKYIPELNLQAVKDPVICEACLLNVQNYSDFVTVILNVEKKINIYCKATGINKKQAQLKNVLGFVKSEALECNINQYAVPRYTTKIDEDQSHIDVNCALLSAVKFDIKTEPTELRLEDNKQSCTGKKINSNSETKLINGDEVHFAGVHNFTVNRDLMCVKNEYNLDGEKHQEKLLTPTMVNVEDAVEQQSKVSKKNNFVEGEVVEIKSEEIEVKTEVVDTSDTEHNKPLDRNLPRRQSRKKKCNKATRKRHQCEICLSWYSAKHVLLNHKFNCHGHHPQSRLYKCNQCIYTTVNKHCFVQHELSHKSFSETTVYNCSECIYKTKYKGNLKGHLLTNHLDTFMLTYRTNSKIQMNSCGMCTYKTFDKRHLKYHEMIHKDKSELATFDCFHCPYKTVRKAHLVRHMRRHTDGRKLVEIYKCNNCTFKSTHKSSLLRHLLVIHKGKPENEVFHCDKCSFQINCRIALRKHKLTHVDSSKLKRFACEVCLYQAPSKSKLKRHSFIHQKGKYSDRRIRLL